MGLLCQSNTVPLFFPMAAKLRDGRAKLPDQFQRKLNLTRSCLRGGDESGTRNGVTTLIENRRVIRRRGEISSV
jgi:hypothetical protein